MDFKFLKILDKEVKDFIWSDQEEGKIEIRNTSCPAIFVRVLMNPCMFYNYLSTFHGLVVSLLTNGQMRLFVKGTNEFVGDWS